MNAHPAPPADDLVAALSALGHRPAPTPSAELAAVLSGEVALLGSGRPSRARRHRRLVVVCGALVAAAGLAGGAAASHGHGTPPTVESAFVAPASYHLDNHPAKRAVPTLAHDEPTDEAGEDKDVAGVPEHSDDADHEDVYVSDPDDSDSDDAPDSDHSDHSDHSDEAEHGDGHSEDSEHASDHSGEHSDHSQDSHDSEHADDDSHDDGPDASPAERDDD